MSTFSMDTLRLLESGQIVDATANIVVTILACLVAVFAGAYSARVLGQGFAS